MPGETGTDTLAATRVTLAPRRDAASASATPMRPLERLPMKRTESIGSRVPPAVTRTLQAVPRAGGSGQGRLDPSEERLGLGQAAGAVLTARGEGALVGLDHLHPALAQEVEVSLRRGVAVHAVVHRGRHEARRVAGEERRGQHRVGRAGGELRDRVGGSRSDEEDVATLREREVANRLVLGHRLARPHAPHLVALPFGDQDRRSDDSLERRGADELRGRRGHEDPDAVAPLGREARQLESPVGGDAARYS